MGMVLCECFNQYDTEADEIAVAVSQAGIDAPRRQQVFTLAGPNDILQVVADALTWTSIAKVLAASAGIPFLTQISKNAADEIWKNRKQYVSTLKTQTRSLFSTLSMAISKVNDKAGLVSIGIDWSRGGRSIARRPAITLLSTADLDEQLLLSIISLSIHGARIRDFLTHFGEREDYDIVRFVHSSRAIGSLQYVDMVVGENCDLTVMLRWRIDAQNWSQPVKLTFSL